MSYCLATQDFNVKFYYARGKFNIVAGYMYRLDLDELIRNCLFVNQSIREGPSLYLAGRF